MISEKLLALLDESAEFQTLVDHLGRGWTSAWVEGLAGAAKAYFATALKESVGRDGTPPPVLIVCPSLERAERLWEDLEAFASRDCPVLLYPASLSLAGDTTDADTASAHRRLEVVERLGRGERPILVAPVEALLQATLPRDAARPVVFALGASIDLQGVMQRLVAMGYDRAFVAEEPGQFALRGGILDVYPSTGGRPARVEFFGDEVESIRAYDPQTQRSVDKLTEIRLMPALEFPGGIESIPLAPGAPRATLLEHLPSETLVLLDEPNQMKAHWIELEREATIILERRAEDESEKLKIKGAPSRDHFVDLDEAIRRMKPFRRIVLTLLARALPWENPPHRIALSSAPPDLFGGQVALLASEMRRWMAAGTRVVVVSENAERLTELLVEQGIPIGHLEPNGVTVFSGSLDSGFSIPGVRLTLLTDTELFGEHKGRAPKRRFKEGAPITSLLDLKEGDMVVHVHYGIGRYRGLVKLNAGGVDREYLQIDYAEPDKVYVPSDELDRVQKYIGSDDHPPTVNRLGGNEWMRTKSRVKARVREMAKELLELYAARESTDGFAYSPDSPWQREMEDGFPYEETPDQLDAILAVKADLEQPKPMDRLICGDVGYGKTEVAIRAAFKAVNDGKQVAVLVPTTVLAQQHLNTFSERLAAFPVTVELMSRFRSPKEQKRALEGLKTGTVDILIGTHRILSKDIEFRDLGLLIVDEEQRFGVAHKERLKQLRQSIDVLTLTATPIPRTLNMSLSGIRDMSVINDPPEGRIPVKTFFLERDDEIIRTAIQRELDRGGQVYFVHNRVDNIERIATDIQDLLPGARVGIGHGQMREGQLERVMMDFYDKAFDVLVCTTIIESGLDIPNVNTIIINNADHFGLAQLYQLRGRVGRSMRQAYCYLLCKAEKVLTEQAEKRLQAIREFTDLGSGYKIALRDLEIRGTGNLLGGEQHGFLVSVGFDLYCQMISEAVKELRGEETEEFKLPPVELPLSAYIPEEYIASDAIRISFYKKLTAVRTLDDVRKIQDELDDRFGDPPRPVWNLLEVLRMRIRAKEAGVSEISIDTGRAIVKIARRLGDDDLRRVLRRFHTRIKFLPDRMLVNLDPKNLLGTIDEILTTLKPREPAA